MHINQLSYFGLRKKELAPSKLGFFVLLLGKVIGAYLYFLYTSVQVDPFQVRVFRLRQMVLLPILEEVCTRSPLLFAHTQWFPRLFFVVSVQGR